MKLPLTTVLTSAAVKEPSSAGGERRFAIEQASFAGGLFVMRGDEAELTMLGSGVPLVSSEHDELVSR